MNHVKLASFRMQINHYEKLFAEMDLSTFLKNVMMRIQMMETDEALHEK